MDENDNLIFIGQKPTMRYVFSVQTQAQNQKQIHIRARGRLISKAVDVALISIERFTTDFGIIEVRIATEKKQNNGVEEKISNIEIVLGKQNDGHHK